MKRKKQKACLLLLCLLAFILFIAPVSAQSLEKEEIERSLIIVGGDHSFPPYEFLDRNGNPTGFNTELTKAIAEVTGMNIAIILGPWAEIRDALETGKIDVIQGMFYSQERDRIFDFTSPHNIVSHTIFTRKDSPRVASVEELKNKEIIVMRGDIMHDYVLKNKLTDKITTVETEAEALKLLASGKHDAVLGARLPGLYWIKKLDLSNIRVANITVSRDKYSFAVKEGNIKLLSRFNDGLMILKDSGRYQEIYDKWLGILEKKRIAREIILNFTLYVLLPLLILLGGMFFWTWFLRKQVSLRTRELEREIAEKERAEEELLFKNTLLEAQSETSIDGILIVDREGKTVLFNKRFGEMWKIPRQILDTRDDDKILHHALEQLKNPDLFLKKVEYLYANKNEKSRDEIEFKDGKVFDRYSSPLIDSNGGNHGRIWFFRDITVRKQAEEKIKTSLKEKELLLKEIHHRVKNNMQVISSILSLQSSSLKDEEAISVFMQCQDRIKSMAIVHEKLYQSENLSEISFQSYTNTLAETIFRSYSEKAEKISLKLDVEDILLDVDTVIPIGLILNELVTNSLKHAFEGQEKGEIKITFREIGEDKLELKVGDNGTGIPEGFDLRNTDSLGLKLVFLLAEEQLKGKVDINRNDGTEFQIIFQKVRQKR